MLCIAVFCILFNVHSDENAHVCAIDRWCIMQMHGFGNTEWTENHISSELRDYFAFAFALFIYLFFALEAGSEFEAGQW